MISNMRSVTDPRKQLLILVIFGLAGIIMIIASGISLFNSIHIKNTYPQTAAEIIGFDSGGSPHISYYVEGQAYEARLSYSTSSMKTGDRVYIFYDPADPGRIWPGGFGAHLITVILGFMGILFTGVPLLILRMLRNRL
jgi:hypothetical protein